MDVSRLAPSPTGALHLGNARTFLINWALARTRGWRLAMRIDDLDGPRIKPDAAREALDILAWLGLDHDGPVLRQTDDPAPYRSAMEELSRRAAVYPCRMTRAEVLAAAAAVSAPNAGDREVPYPASLRPATIPAGWGPDDVNHRFTTPAEDVVIDDQIAGEHVVRPADDVGDFLVWTQRGAPAYQLAVVVDDARQGVTDVVRGDDLLPSAARQTLLYRALERPAPRWWHLPLVLGADGRRLAKRHGDTRLSSYRSTGVTAERIIGLLGWWSGAAPERTPMAAAEFREAFSLDRMSRHPVTFTEDDHRWLLDRPDGDASPGA